MRNLVTRGGTGVVGCHTVAALVAAGHEPRLLVRSPDRVARALGPIGVDPAAVETVVGDVTDGAGLRRAAAGCDAALHAASVWTLDPRRAGEIARVNAPGTRIVLRSAAAGLVHVSSYTALPARRSDRLLGGDPPVGAPPVPSAASKAASEAVARGLQGEGAPVAMTYPGMVWEPHDPHQGETSRLALLVLAGSLPLLPAGTIPVSDVRGVVAPVAAASGAVGEALGRLGVTLLASREGSWLASQDGHLDTRRAGALAEAA